MLNRGKRAVKQLRCRRGAGAAVVLMTLAGLPAVTGALPGAHAGKARADELTMSQDYLRTGWDPREPGLSPAVVASGSFRQLFSAPVNGQVFGQPIVVGSTVIVATQNNWVYGLNAITGQRMWSVSVGQPWPVAGSPFCRTASGPPNIGITSTPAYDPSTRTVYVMARMVAPGRPVTQPITELVGINIVTGMVTERVPITGTATNYPGRTFNSYYELQRPGLLMLNGWIYAAFAGFCDTPPYSGYIAGVQVATRRTTLWTDEAGATDGAGGIWQSGGGLVSDGPGQIIFASGNGTVPAPGPGLFWQGNRPQPALANSVVRLGVQLNGSLQAEDFFSPANADVLNYGDRDFGSGGPVGLPFGTFLYPHLLVEAGKDGRVFVLNRDNLGGRLQGRNGTDAALSVAGPFAGEWAHPAAFGDAAAVSPGRPGDDYVYYLGANDYLRALRLIASPSGTPVLVDVGNSSVPFAFASGSPVVTSAGTTPSSAVVWMVSMANPDGVGGTLQAFGAIPQAPCSATVASPCLRKIWSAPLGTVAHFAVPATDSGRVYVGTADGHVLGFGAVGRAPMGPIGVSGFPSGQASPDLIHLRPAGTDLPSRAAALMTDWSKEPHP